MTARDVEALIEEHGVETVVAWAIDALENAPADERASIVTGLQEACGVSIGGDSARWKTWLQELRKRGSVGFGPLPESRVELPADVSAISEILGEAGVGAPPPPAEPSAARPATPGSSVHGRTTEVAEEAPSLLDDDLLADVPVHVGYKVLGGVVLYQKLGQGGMGAVYKGRHLRLDIDVALKVMSLPAGLPLEETDNFVKRFLREAKTAATINHTNLVRVMDVNAEYGIYFLVMDYVAGESAGERLQRKGRLAEEEAVEICLGAAEGLAAAHRRGIVHRDVKPDNIMIDRDGCVRVTDLGLAKAFSAEGEMEQRSVLTQTQTAMGTPHYMSPEQFVSTRTVGPPADVWSLGVMLYELLTASVPWTDSSAYAVAIKVTNEPLPDVKQAHPGLSDGVCAIIEKALCKDAAERYADCGEMAKVLRAHFSAICGVGTSVLPDAEAGMTRMAILTVTPPHSNTMTLIEGAVLGGGPRTAPPPARPKRPVAPLPEAATPATIAPVPPAPSRAWIVPALIAGGVALLVALLMALLLGGRTQERGPLEEDARRFYERLLELAAADKHDEVLQAVQDAEGKYDRTGYGVPVRQLREASEKDVAKRNYDDAIAKAGAAEKEGRLDDAIDRYEAANGIKRSAEIEATLATLKQKRDRFNVAKGEADRHRDAAKKATGYHEKQKHIDEEIKSLKKALETHEDQRLRSRLDELERRIEVVRLMVEAALRREAKDWRAAEEKLASARATAASNEDREEIDRRLPAVRKQIVIADDIGAAEKAIAERKPEEACELARKAEQDGASEAQLAELLRKIRKLLDELAPKKSITGPRGIELILVAGGTFSMGSKDGKDDEKPVRAITVSDYYIGRYETTNAQFASRPATSVRDGKLPAVSVSWNEAVGFCGRLTEADEKRAKYRLPTEAEWEFAARGTKGRAYPWGSDLPTSRQANLVGGADGYSGLAPVGSFREGATPEGILDLVGNAAEWCADWYGPYAAGDQSDPTGPARGKYRVVRGSAFAYDGKTWSRACARSACEPARKMDTLGFRVVRELAPDERKLLKLKRELENAE